MKLHLNQKIDQKLRAGNPWVFADAIDPPDDLQTGSSVDVISTDGSFVGRGIYERNSPIAVRMWTLRDEPVDDTLLFNRIAEADQQRRHWLTPDTTGFRLLGGEGDRTPGIVVDLYGDVAVIRIDGHAAERWLDATVDALSAIRDVKHFVVRRSEKYRGKHPKAIWLTDPKREVTFLEHGATFECDPIAGQKTGFFLDQRANRQRVATWSRSRRVLNLFGYTGGFSVIAALAGAAETTTVDLAKPALEMAKRNFAHNEIDPNAHQFVASDVEAFLDTMYPRTAPYDVVICDPPSFAHRRKDKPKAIKTYTRIFAKTLRVMPRFSTVALASCSSHINSGDFRAIVRSAAESADINLTVHGNFGPDVDHPYPIGFPEHDYLQFMLATIA